MNNNLKIIDIPQNERPREKIIKYGPDSLSNVELLALLLRTGTSSENVITLSSRILKEVHGLNGLFSASAEELMCIKGVKEAKATQILALCEIFKRFRSFEKSEYKISSPKDVAELLTDEVRSLEQEVFILIMLNTKNVVIGKKELFKGTLNSSVVHPREVFKEALKKSANSIIISHNHPSGDPTPSKEDVNITLRIKECGKLIGIDLIDHIIIGNNKFISMKEKGIL
ncbi:DNA replication and repair protein RadC [Clostridium cavendishii DSM 21758]|uniref:DNA replication and repair protein RadC n=1 Tax=Clostridium cavendishii DSM 21758 TaxID=1121302 RepID=A0A1M6BKW1_9CLOT|nr:DNA repair protein RadC [Clostridium cavendishii]SHI49359.1 DNA replication and repair protein RadC [Clostridium cavendishii DSM 21758]